MEKSSENMQKNKATKDDWANRLHEVYDDWGRYMDYKKAKLEEQYREEAAVDFKEASDLFKGIAIFVNGYTDPPSDELRRLMMAHGGVFHHYLRTGRTTHMIATNLPYSKIVMYKKAQNPLPLCKPEWITDSIKAGKVLDYRKYLLYSQHTKTQPKLANIFDKFKTSSTSDKNNLKLTNDVNKDDKSCKVNGGNDLSMQNISRMDSIFDKPQSTMLETKNAEKSNNGQIPDSQFSSQKIESMNIFEKPQSTMIEEKQANFEVKKYRERNEKNREVTVITSTQVSTSEIADLNCLSIFEKPQSTLIERNEKTEEKQNIENQKSENLDDKKAPDKIVSAIERNCTKNAEFLNDFYNNSRLHHIATMGAMFKEYINELRDKSDGVFPGLKRLANYRRINEAGPSSRVDLDLDSEDDMFGSDDSTAKKENILMHIDMDCFFVSVGLRNHPELRGLPVAVAHAKGNKMSKNDEEFGSMSEIASCSYEARKAGVKNGMFLGQALKLCPNLRTIRYDFEGYKEVSYALYDTVASYTLQIEAVSCDEMYVDCSELLQKSRLSAMVFANILRKEIKDKTGCPVSTGFGRNKLQARLATKKAKPDGQFHLKGEDVESYIGSLTVKDLPGVGYTTATKLKQMNVGLCSDLQKIALYNLQKEFGKKTGELLYNMCRGIDNSKLNVEHVRKSVSAEVNYGIRFTSEQEAINFFEKLSIEVCSRLKKVNAKGRSVTLKLMVRAKEAPKEAAKFMGHGVCDYFTKTKNLMSAVDDDSIIKKEVISLWHQMQQIPQDIRGIGIQITRLESTKNKPASKSSMLNFINKAKEDPKPAITSTSTSNISKTESSSSNTNNSNSKNILRQHSEEHEIVGLSSASNSGKSNSQTTVRKTQTKPEDYFRKTKPLVSRSAKVELPSLQEIDMSVLVELPEDIRNEILNEYKSKNGPDVKNVPQEEPKNESPIVNKQLQKVARVENNIDADLSFSQVDPEFLAALSEDMRNDVKAYCQMKKREKMMFNNKKTVDVQKSNLVIQREIVKTKGTRKRKVDKLGGMKVGNAVGTKKAKIVAETEIEKPIETKRFEKAEIKKIEEVKVDKVVARKNEKNSEIQFESCKFYIDNSKVEENREILTTLVNCMLNLPLEQVKAQIQAWILNSEVINEIDFLSIATYLGMLPQLKRIEDLHVLIKTMHRCVTKLGNCVWHETYKKIAEHIQHNMQLEYNSDLMLPPMIGCNRCMR